ncbi:MAG: phosphonate ABC transporter, permease protein PhnE [Hyphomicrobiales bacterium]|nr:phosphonate ABC transporter, permease protein PhnE [Hyphomicrobiales bacterium]
MKAGLSIADCERLVASYPYAFRPSFRRRVALTAGVAVGFGAFCFGVLRLDFDFGRLGSGFRQLAWFLELMVPPSPGQHLTVYLYAMGETLAIAFLGTLLASAFAFVAGFCAARNVLPIWIARFSTRRLFDAIRGIDMLVWALIWINVVGLGPFAGVLAIATSDFGALGKLFSEAIETIDERQIDGVRAAGGGRISEIRFGVVPQVLPIVAGQILYFIESNTRSATIIGIVGAGGIGLHLAEQIRTLEWRQVSFIVLLILGAVAAIDFVSSRLRAGMTISG